MLKFRRYMTQDNKAVKELHYAGVAQMGGPSSGRGEQAFSDTDLDDIESVYLKGGDFIVGLENGEIVAMGAFKRKTPVCAEFKRLRVRPDRQRMGYGEAITRKLAELASHKGYTEAFLDTLVTNTSAQRLVEKCGFKKSGRGKRGIFELFYYRRKLNEGGK
jgi:ribosomal protein S18 acetylase RimI-like enzyme